MPDTTEDKSKIRDRLAYLVEEMLDGQLLLNEVVTEFKSLYIQRALIRNENHLSRTASRLGITQKRLKRRIGIK